MWEAKIKPYQIKYISKSGMAFIALLIEDIVCTNKSHDKRPVNNSVWALDCDDIYSIFDSFAWNNEDSMQLSQLSRSSAPQMWN